MSDEDVRDLARRAGIAVDWIDADGVPRQVSVETLRALLRALDLPCAMKGDIAESRQHLATQEKNPPNLITATVGERIRIAHTSGECAEMHLEDGTRRAQRMRRTGNASMTLRIDAPPGYHRLRIGAYELALAVAPRKCWTIDDAAPGGHIWGIAAQLYGLSRVGHGLVGDTGAVAALARASVRHGADAIALSPTHAMFGADPRRYGPYSPSTRLFLNPVYADAAAILGELAEGLSRPPARRGRPPPLIDWPRANRARYAALRRLFERFRAIDAAAPLARDFVRYCAAQGSLLKDHARFEALHAARLRADPKQWSWRRWPSAWRDPRSPTVERFAAAHADEIRFHMFAQWVAERAFAAAQRDAREAGMRIGLVADLAVGMDADGSHAWSRQNDVLVGLSVGAPPDAFNPRGQNWGLTSFSPQALIRTGYAPFLATLRAAMRHSGGVRIDHAMGLQRLWMVPDGMAPDQGAYLAYPRDDLLRLVALESQRHRAIVIAEDLGTVPDGFRDKLDETGIAGMRVLWFEHAGQSYRPPRAWPANAAALTTTHDLPTVAGWWRGTDLCLRRALKLLTPREARRAQEIRSADRRTLWRACVRAGVARGRMPATSQPARAVDAALAFVARTRSKLALIPLEDILGLSDQPNVPGTIDEHPNWRRRVPQPVERMLEPAKIRQRLVPLRRRRR